MNNHILTLKKIDAYTQYLHAEERAAATIEKYSHDILAFAAWLEDKPVTKEIVAQWKERLLTEENCSPATVNAKLSALHGLLRFLGWEECKVKFVKVQKRTFRDASRDLSRDEYQRLVDTARRLGRERLVLLLETICATGIRVSEVKYITVEAVRDERTDVSLKGKIRPILLPAKLCRKLKKYAQKQKIVSGEIFLSENGGGKSLSRTRIWREMKRICKEAGVEPSKVFPHNLRHLFATTFYRATKDIVKLADILGHSSTNTTRIYLLSTDKEHVRYLEQLRLVS